MISECHTEDWSKNVENSTLSLPEKNAFKKYYNKNVHFNNIVLSIWFLRQLEIYIFKYSTIENISNVCVCVCVCVYI